MTEILKTHPKFTYYYCNPMTTEIFNKNMKNIKKYTSQNGYEMVSIYDNTKYRGVYVHRFIFECVNGLIPKGLEIDHVDNKKTNNIITNLQLLTHKENLKKSAVNRNYSFVKDNHKNKHIIKAVEKNNTETLFFNSMYACQQSLKINVGIIKYCCEGKNNVKSGKSKLNGKNYKFYYVNEIPDGIKLIKLHTTRTRKIATPKLKILCSVCHHKYAFIEKHMNSKYHLKNLK